METKQTQNIDRIIFLQKFTEEIIKNLSKRHDVERNIRIEKLKQKFSLKPSMSNPDPEVHDAFKKILNHKILESHRYQKNIVSPQSKKSDDQDSRHQKDTGDSQSKNIPIKHQEIRPLQRPQQSLRPSLQLHKQVFTPRLPVNPVPVKNMTPGKQSIIETIRPEYSQKPVGFTLGKIDVLTKDPFVQLLECPGPGKNVLVKKYNKINVTKVILGQNDISDIIKIFSQDSKIPIVGGILKAAVGDLIISAVESEQAGSRFIISKINPM